MPSIMRDILSRFRKTHIGCYFKGVSQINKKKVHITFILFLVFSFIVLPAVAFPLLIRLNQLDRFGYVLGGYFGIATQITSLYFKEARIWRLRLFDYTDGRKVGMWVNILILAISALIFCYGIYYVAFGWTAQNV